MVCSINIYVGYPVVKPPEFCPRKWLCIPNTYLQVRVVAGERENIVIE
jgi:hypothetical protein